MEFKKDVIKPLAIILVPSIIVVFVPVAYYAYCRPVFRLKIQAYFGDTGAMLRLARITHEMKWFYSACDAGNSQACYAIWSFNERRRPQEAFKYLKKGAELELKQRKGYECLLELSRVYEYGLLGQPQNPEEAARIRNLREEIVDELRAKGMIL